MKDKILCNALGAQPRESRIQIEPYLLNPDNTIMVSFPRCGCHWVRMLMELYFERPTLPAVFYYFDFEPNDELNYVCYYTHDIKLNIKGPKSIIYFYRDPVDVLHSLIRARELQFSDTELDIFLDNRIAKYADLYARHLHKWLIQEQFTEKKTIFTYEELRNSPVPTWAKIIGHFGIEEVDELKLLKILKKLTYKEVNARAWKPDQKWYLGWGENRKTQAEYKEDKNNFREQYKNLIWQILLEENQNLLSYFEYLGAEN